MRGAVTVERVEALAVKYLRQLGLLPFHLRILVYRRPEDEPDEDQRSNAAWIAIDDGYSQATMAVHDWAIPLRQLDWFVAHEIGHIPGHRALCWLKSSQLGSAQETIEALDEELACRFARALTGRAGP